MERILNRTAVMPMPANGDLIYPLAKRILDFVISAAALVALFPLFLVIAFLVKLDGGPIFYRQTRIGKNGRRFTFHKFRSMIPDADRHRAKLMAQTGAANGVLFKMKKDPRVTTVGQVLRKYSLDELPQLWNVMVGDMSLVGPRPALPSEVDTYTPEHHQRLQVEQGLTCFWQVSGRSDLNFEQQVALDLDYIAKASLLTDLQLLFRTIPAVLGGKGAY